MFEGTADVVVGADDSDNARQVVAAAAELVRATGGRLHIVTSNNAYTGPSKSATGVYVETPHRGEGVLDGLADIAKQHGLDPVLHHSTDAPATAVVATAEEVGATLVVVGNKGMKGVRRVLGSVPNAVAHKAPCSVLIVDTEGDADGGVEEGVEEVGEVEVAG
jgi:nucleotide-binding universal stress UspA family protein